MDRIKKFIKENTFLSISLLLLFITLIIIAVAYIPNRDNNKLKTNKTNKENIDYTDLEKNATNGVYLKSDNVNCPEMSLASNSYSDFFVTKDGRLFKYDLNRLFDNDKNCKEITWNISGNKEKASAVFRMIKNNMNYTYVLGGTEFDNSSIRQYNYDRYYRSYSLNYLNGYEVTTKDYAIGYAFTIPAFENITIYQLTNSKAIIEDGILYYIKLNVENINATPKFVYNYDIVDIAFEPKRDETITKILDSVIITDKRIYTYGLVDDDCMKYVDRECTYGYTENVDLSRILSEILFVDAYHVILKDGTSYVVTTYGLE